MQELEKIIKDSGDETSTHCERVAQYVQEFLSVDKCDYTDDEIKYIITGAYLHDIGKSAIDKKILYKPSGITEEELQILHRHSAYGYQILTEHKHLFENDTEYEICRNIALMHHRRVDNTGYPILQECELPYYIQVVSIIDVYDALTSKRCYHNAVSRSDALKIINSGAGGLFNPELIEKLQKYITKVMR